ncbi:hypothetical protein SAMN05216371_7281 [Streptomyces sp. TLI_053]|uniref:hypothetical protein n=1 Tax=Streptomyces sp. TLI_053 TaxID=1855352 RepID=UPI00087DAF26|nr:hypothetical protein [Streptomyces sp. TLI_053]SDT82493.1 hypothetical protein SAMN05216371_7281 [Streptomyces sp. TLI_053]
MKGYIKAQLLAVAGMATAALLGASPAGALASTPDQGIVPPSVAKCGSQVCLSVVGQGRYVSAVQVGVKKTDGYFFAKVRGSGEWVWTDWQTTNGLIIYIKPLSDRTYPEGTVICAGVSQTHLEMDYINEVCATIHS